MEEYRIIMSKKYIRRTLALLLVLVLAINLASCGNKLPEQTESPSPGVTTSPGTSDIMADVPANRYDASKTARTGNNETNPLILSTGALDSKFSPFFATSPYDTDISSITQLGLLAYDKDGLPATGIDAPCFAYDYKTEISSEDSTSTYTFILKNGITFSDGKPISAKDMLFSIYVLCDPQYDGSSAFNTIAIQGINEYRLQTNEETIKRVDTIIKAGIKTGADGSMLINPAQGIASAEQQAFWSNFDKAGENFSQAIIDFVNTNYARYIPNFFSPYTAEQISANPSMQAAFAMVMWKYGSLSEVGIFEDAMGKAYDLAKDKIDAKVFWSNIVDAHGYDLGDDAINSERANNLTIQDYVKSLYIKDEGKVEGGVQNISGITSGKMNCDDGVEREYIKIVLDAIDPTAIYKMDIFAAPLHYYTEGYTGTLNENGVDLDNKDFMDFLKTRNDKPLGAGPYIFQDYKSNVVAYTANDSFLLGSPKIKTLHYQEVSIGNELDALKSVTTHLSKPSASMTIVKDISAGEGDYAKLNYVLSDNNSYGYIGIQGQAIPEIKVRKAIAHACNVQLAVDNHYQELASANYRTMSKVLWAYPDNPENLFPYDETGKTSKDLFIDAGYKYDEEKNIMTYPEGHEKSGQQVTFKFTLPTKDANTHPASSIFIDTKKVLAKIGVKVNIESDDNLLSKLTTAYDSGIQVWASARGSGGFDPDMFPIWYSDSRVNHSNAPSTIGLHYLFKNGSDEQKSMLAELNKLIIEGRSAVNKEERKSIYEKALELSTGLAVEIPTFQRKNMYVYNKEVINESSLLSGDDITSFQGPLSYIWNVELN